LGSSNMLEVFDFGGERRETQKNWKNHTHFWGHALCKKGNPFLEDFFY
jgi:hypothetical protein